MKRLFLTLSVLVSVALVMEAQHLPKSFFDAHGNVRMETQELDEAADTLVTIFHRGDDIEWHRTVYRVIDMRFKQNFQLYFPVHTNHERYHNLLNVIANAVVDGMPIYSTEFNLTNNKINPNWEDESLLSYLEIPGAFQNYEFSESLYFGDDDAMAMYYDITKSPAKLIWCNDTADAKSGFTPNYTNFESLVRNQLKYLVQEVIFFDRHYSRLYSKIIGIAPLYSAKIETTNPETPAEYGRAMLESIMFWVSYDDLRPYIAKQYMIPTDNESKRLTFEEFFQKKMYSSYIVAISDMYDRQILDYYTKKEDVEKEQQRIEEFLLNFEQDLWEY